MYRKSRILLMVFVWLITACGNLPGEAYPAPDESYPAPWEPVAGDANLSREEVSITENEIRVDTSDPQQHVLFISGTLPTPCHQLRVTVSTPDEENQIFVEVYSVVDPSEICIQVLEAFEEDIPLGSFSSGSQITYTVYVNDQPVGQFVP